MNDLERLKRAEESEPMAVLPGHFPESCDACFCCYEEPNHNYRCDYMDKDCEAFCNVPEWCPWLKAIGIIEPGCRVRYFGEDET